ncbi:hypothetical protein [Feifania hominis]|uniref:Uncharacterized protein n=1 Tax=Feifania hominis TaxID=2763660 RepID=A0A926HU09_9FIRM|nr:hypothetical protein [Feifania hominis]MBC8536419.1 hypothetical protein [Feifania hominis]
MKYRKKTIQKLDHCYAVNVMDVAGEPYAFFAAENKNPCIAVDCATQSRHLTVWEEPGGTMGLVPIPGRPGEFLAGQKFYRLYEWEEACIAWVKPDGRGGYISREICTKPYLHRFDLLQRDGRTWLIACTLAAHKQTREDWTWPGSIYVAPFPDDWDGELDLTELKGDCFQNHGYARISRDGHDVGLVTCAQGVFEFFPPRAGSEDWEIRQIMTQATSDADIIDIDADGQEEIATIEQFHGSYFRIYKKIDGRYQQVFEHPEVTEFYHVVKAGRLAGRPCFVGGFRRGKQQLFVVWWDEHRQEFVVDTVDEGVGPSNACIYNGSDADALYVADREVGEAAVYFVEE